jgi:hypothetical protein
VSRELSGRSEYKYIKLLNKKYLSGIFPRVKQLYFIISLVIFFSYTGEAHSLKVEKILYQEKSPYQEVLVFEVLSSYWYQKYKLPLVSVLYNLVIFVCSRQPMAKSSCLMVLFNWLIRMNVHTRKWLLTSPLYSIPSPKKVYFLILAFPQYCENYRQCCVA